MFWGALQPHSEETVADVPEEIHDILLHNVLYMTGSELQSDDEPILRDILKNVTEVKRRNLWNAGYHWLEQSTQPGGRFANLNLDETIMPLSSKRESGDIRLPIRAHLEREEDAPLMDMIRDTPGHLYLIGEGGIGKTTALYSIMKHVYGPGQDEKDIERNRLNGQVPLYIELSKAPDTYGRLYEGGKSTFIHRAIYQQLRQDLSAKQVPGSAVKQLDEVFNIDPETAVNPIHDLFTQQSPAPEYLLLLDGLNEVSRVVIEHREEPEMKSAVITMILQEIHQLMTECPNVRVILTSRSKEQTNWGDETTLLYLSGVNDDSVKDYLAKANVSQARIESAINNEKLRDVLRVPLFLTLYAALDGDEGLLTQGEILHLFFHQKKKTLYSTRTRIDQVEEDVDKAASAKQFHCLTATMQGFILDFILPEIAWRMEQNDMFHIYRIGDEDEVNLSSIIEHVLTDESDTAVCGRYAEAYEEYLSDSDAAQDTLAIAEDMIERLGGRMRRVVDNILNCAVMTLGILQKNSDEYSFIHHHIRDYFAAVYQINRLKLAVYLQNRKKNELARECLSDWKAEPLRAEVRRFIGEALGEAHNAPVCDEEGNWHYVVPSEPCERNLIKRCLDVLRDRNDEINDYCVWNFLEIMKETRRDLSGEDYSRLNLLQCRASGAIWGHKGCAAKFHASLIDNAFFMQQGHKDIIISVGYGAEDRCILTASKSEIIIWDAMTLQELHRLDIKNRHKAICSASFSSNGKFIVASSRDGVTQIWETSNFSEIGEINGQYAQFSPNCAYLVTMFEMTNPHWNLSWEMCKWNGVSFGKVGTIWSYGSLQWEDSFWKYLHSEIIFSDDSKHVVLRHIYDYHKNKQWNTETLESEPFCKEREYVGYDSHPSKYSPDGRSLVYYDKQECSINIYELATQKINKIRQLKKEKTEGEKSVSAAFSNDGQKVVYADGSTCFSIVDLNTQEYIEIRSKRGTIQKICMNPQTKSIIGASADGTIKIWDSNNYRIIDYFQGHKHMVTDMIFDRYRECYISASTDGTLKFWDAERNIETISLAQYNPIVSVQLCYGGKGFWTVSENKSIDLWTLNDLRKGPIPLEIDRIKSATFSPDGSRLIVLLNDENTNPRLYFMPTIKYIELEREVGWYDVENVSFSRDGRYILTTGAYKASIFDAMSLRVVCTLCDASGDIENTESAVFGRDSDSVISLPIDKGHIYPDSKIQGCGTVKVWDISNTNRVRGIRKKNWELP